MKVDTDAPNVILERTVNAYELLEGEGEVK